MRADAIGKLIGKLNALQHAAEAAQANSAAFDRELPADLPDLPEQAAGEVPGRPELIQDSRPEFSGLPEEVPLEEAGRPEPLPTSRPEDLKAAYTFCEQTGLPMVAMADDCDAEDDLEAATF